MSDCKYLQKIGLCELQARLKDSEGLLRVAKCPSCDGSGIVAVGSNETGWEPEQCQWCSEKKTLLGEE